MNLDLLVVAAHPDDAEISCGGTILRTVEAGGTVGVVDMTRGEMGTRGTAEDRKAEADAATAVMGLAARRNMELPDGRVQVTVEAREALAAVYRELRPRIVISHTADDHHPDHAATGRLAKEAWYLSGLKRLAELAGGPEARRPARLLQFMSHQPFDPTLVVDIGAVWERKVELIRCYASQIRPAHERDTGAHFLSGTDILHRVETRARYWGERVGVRYGEPLFSRAPLPVTDLGFLS